MCVHQDVEVSVFRCQFTRVVVPSDFVLVRITQAIKVTSLRSYFDDNGTQGLFGLSCQFQESDVIPISIILLKECKTNLATCDA